jgi:general secretion pathway protein F/type IV pilus assembly protein PilC
MPDFAYIARDLTGQKVAGSISAATEREVISILSGKSLFPVKVTAEKVAVTPNAHLKVRGQTMATVCRLPRCSRAACAAQVPGGARDQTSHKNLKVILEEVYKRVEDGSTLGDAMLRFPRAFSEMAINMVRAGGEGGF